MAERKPLVQINGQVRELPAGDSLPAPALKTVNGQSLHGEGDLDISGGGTAEAISPFLLMGA
jgi:hypothetical protein